MEKVYTVDLKKSETLKKMAALTEHVIHFDGHYSVDHKPKYFQSCLELVHFSKKWPKSKMKKILL